MTSQPGLQTIAMHILPTISQNKKFACSACVTIGLE